MGNAPSDLHKAAGDGDVVALREALSRSHDIDIREPVTRQTPLHAASSVGSESCVSELLDAGALVDARDCDGATPLLCACVSGHATVVKMLVAKMPSAVDVADDSGYTALYAACEYGFPELVELLLATHNVMLNRAAADGTTPLYISCQEDGADCARLLVRAGAATHVVTPEGRTPLHAACLAGSEDCVRVLLEAIAGGRSLMNAVDALGFSPLHLCAECSNSALGDACADLLLAAGATVTPRPNGSIQGDDYEDGVRNDEAERSRRRDRDDDSSCSDCHNGSAARRSRSRSRSRDRER